MIGWKVLEYITPRLFFLIHNAEGRISKEVHEMNEMAGTQKPNPWWKYLAERNHLSNRHERAHCNSCTQIMHTFFKLKCRQTDHPEDVLHRSYCYNTRNFLMSQVTLRLFCQQKFRLWDMRRGQQCRLERLKCSAWSWWRIQTRAAMYWNNRCLD